MVLATLTVVAAAVLAFANGANDVSKGVATLAGNGGTSYRTPLAWGTLWTCVGAIASLVISIGLMKAFTSAMVAPEVLASPAFALAVAAGAGAWVVLASVTGLPVSTTHALTGAIVGVALVAGGPGAVGWWMLVSMIAAPLALSPVVSAGLGYVTQSAAERNASRDFGSRWPMRIRATATTRSGASGPQDVRDNVGVAPRAGGQIRSLSWDLCPR